MDERRNGNGIGDGLNRINKYKLTVFGLVFSQQERKHKRWAPIQVVL